MPKRNLYVFLVLFLSACAPVVTPAPTIDATALYNRVDATVRAQLTEIAAHQPTITSTTTLRTVTPIPMLTSTPEFTRLVATSTPPPPTFLPLMTPDTIQIEQWREYQIELAKGILPMDPPEIVLCEWDILARSDRVIYVWAVCASPLGDDGRPAVLHLDLDGFLKSVAIYMRGSSATNEPFPEEARARFSLYTGDSIFTGRLKEIYRHIKYRRTHPGEPPLIVLSALPTATPTP